MSSAEHLRRTARVVVAGVVAIAAGLVAAPSASADEVYPRPAGTTHRLPRPRLGPRQRDVAVRQPGWGAGRARPGSRSSRTTTPAPPWAASAPRTIRVRVASLGSSVQAYPATGPAGDLEPHELLGAARDAATASPSRAGGSCPARRSPAPRPGSSCSTSPRVRRRGALYATALGVQHRGVPQPDQRHRHDAARQHQGGLPRPGARARSSGQPARSRSCPSSPSRSRATCCRSCRASRRPRGPPRR